VVEGASLVHWFREHLDDDDFFPWTRGAVIVPGDVAGPGSIIQSNFGTSDVRNFEVVVPVRHGDRTELRAFFRNNAAQTPWQPAGRVTSETDDVAGAAALFQSNFGDNNNFEVVVPLRKGPRVELWHFFRNNDEAGFPWRPGARVTGPDDDVLWGASLIQSNFGPRDRGNFEVAVPLRAANGKVELWHFFMDSATLQWHRAGMISADVSGPGVLIQSDFGDRDHGNFEVVVPEHHRLVHYFFDNQRPGGRWQRGAIVMEALDGWASLIQSNFGLGDHKNFEVMADEANGAVVHYWRSNVEPHGPWLRSSPIVRQPHGARLPNTRRIVQLTGEFDRSLDKDEPGRPFRREGDGSFICTDRPPFAFNQTETKAGIQGTDLGVSFEHDGKTFFLFGDTWRVGHPEGTINFDAIAFTTDTNPDDGLSLTFLPSPPIIVPPVPQGEFNVPLDGISVAGTMFVFFTTDARKLEGDRAVMGRAILTRSTDGQRFDQLYELSRSKFINVSIVRRTLRVDEARNLGLTDPDVLLIWGSGIWRSSTVYLAILPMAGLETREGLRFYAGQRGTFVWSDHEADATPLVPAGCVGELSVRWNSFLGRYLLMYNSDDPGGIVLHTAKKPWGPWSRAPVTVFDPNFRRIADGIDPRDPCLGAGFGRFIHVDWDVKKCDCVHDSFFDRPRPAHLAGGDAYGPYQIAHMAKGDASGTFSDVYFTMSTWNPYQVMLMTTRLEASVINTPADALARSHADAGTFLTQSHLLSAAGRVDEAVGQARGAVDVLRDLDPARSAEVDHLMLLAAAQHTLARRLVEAGRVDEALQPAADCVATYRLAAEAGANAHDIGGQLFNMSTLLASVSRLDAAMGALIGAIDILGAATPPPDQLAANLTLLGVCLQTLAVHLIAAGRVPDAVTRAREAIAVYRRAAAAAGADRDAIGGQLLNLSNALSSAGQRDAAAEAAQAAVDVLRG
jgi:hypothetical protein